MASANPNGPALIVDGPVNETGIIAGATVRAGGRLTLSGICTGDLVVEEHGMLVVGGIAQGRVLCQGGSVQINGIAEELFAQNGNVKVTGIVHRLHRGRALLTVETRAVVYSES